MYYIDQPSKARKCCIILNDTFLPSFYPRPVLAFGYCRCLRLSVCVWLSVCVSGNSELVGSINHHAFKLEPPNLIKRCKRTWLRFLLFLGDLCYTRDRHPIWAPSRTGDSDWGSSEDNTSDQFLSRKRRANFSWFSTEYIRFLSIFRTISVC